METWKNVNKKTTNIWRAHNQTK